MPENPPPSVAKRYLAMVLAGGIAGVVVGLASLEAFAGVCVGCVIHSLLVRFGLLRAPVCENCVPATVRSPG